MADSSRERQWRPIGHIAPTALVDARLQTHHAAQLVVSAAISFLQPQADDSHTSLQWSPELNAMVGSVLSEAKGARFALRPSDLTLLALTDGPTVAGAFALSCHTTAEADGWMRGVLGRLGLAPSRLSHTKHYEIPAHHVGMGQQFQLEIDESNAELSAYFQNAWWLTTRMRDEHPGASEPRIWPHHFDLATLIPVATPSGAPPRTIGVGISPGDGSFAQPYIYVGPSPNLPLDRLPALSIGHWHTTGWMGGVLTGTEFAGETGAERALAFSREAVAACERAFGVV